MERKFKVGDRVRIIRSVKPEMVGQVSTVVRITKFNGKPGSSWLGIFPVGTETCVLDIPSRQGKGWHVAYPHDYLEPYYDGNERVAWSSCVWQPNRVSS